MNQTFTNENELTFTKNYSIITACKKLSPMDKLLIARVLNWQQNKLICTQSNQSLADELGVSLKTLKNTITKLNKTPFFNSKEVSHFNEHGKWSNSKEIIIDEAALFEYVSVSKTKQNEPIQLEIAPEKIKEVKQTEVEDFDVELPIQELLNFIDEYKEDYHQRKGVNGKHFIIKKFVNDGRLTTKNKIIREFESYNSTVV
jgi:hypothetical protein